MFTFGSAMTIKMLMHSNEWFLKILRTENRQRKVLGFDYMKLNASTFCQLIEFTSSMSGALLYMCMTWAIVFNEIHVNFCMYKFRNTIWIHNFITKMQTIRILRVVQFLPHDYMKIGEFSFKFKFNIFVDYCCLSVWYWNVAAFCVICAEFSVGCKMQ